MCFEDWTINTPELHEIDEVLEGQRCCKLLISYRKASKCKYLRFCLILCTTDSKIPNTSSLLFAGWILKHSPPEKRLLVVPHHPAQAYRNTDPPAASRHRTRTKAKHITSERHAVWLPSSLLLLSQSFQSHSLTHQGLWLLAQSQFQILGGLCVGHLSNTPRPMILDSFS